MPHLKLKKANYSDKVLIFARKIKTYLELDIHWWELFVVKVTIRNGNGKSYQI